MNRRPRVYIASPYTIGDTAINVRRQILCADALMEAGFAPYAPLAATHFQHMMCPRKYEDWIDIDLIWVLQCDVLLRLSGESKGADGEVAYAEQHGIPVVYSIEELLKHTAQEPGDTVQRLMDLARSFRHAPGGQPYEVAYKELQDAIYAALGVAIPQTPKEKP